MPKFKNVIALLEQERREHAKREVAQETEAKYKQAQIDYDLTHEHSDKKDVAKFEEQRDKALAEAEEHRLAGAEVDAALELLRSAD
jgi:hypothetical protein